jgi:hypothetical protein
MSRNKISKTKTGIKLCQDYDEKIDHIRTACPVLAKEQYISSDMIRCVLKYKHIKKVRKPDCAMNKRKLTETSMTIKHTLLLLFIFSGSVAQRGLWPPRSRGFLITNNDAPRSVGLLWTSDQLVAETSTWQHTTDKHPCRQWDSNPRSQQASGRRPTP